MATLRQIRRRIRTVRSTRHITKAMEMVAAAKLRRAQQSALAARPYAEAMEELLRRLAGEATDLSHPLFEVRPVERLLLIVVASDKGLCGGFNANVLRTAAGRIAELGAARVRVAPVGRRAWRFYKSAGWELTAGSAQIGDLADLARAKTLASGATELFLSRGVDRVEVVYTRFESIARRSIESAVLLPVESQVSAGRRGAYIFEPNPEAVLAALAPRYVATRIFAILASSLAAEHAARMLAMGSATRNADDVIERLTLLGNKVRQAGITKELLEVVGGAEALV